MEKKTNKLVEISPAVYDLKTWQFSLSFTFYLGEFRIKRRFDIVLFVFVLVDYSWEEPTRDL